MQKLILNTFIIAMAASVPILIGCAFYFENANLAFWAIIPFIFFMAG